MSKQKQTVCNQAIMPSQTMQLINPILVYINNQPSWLSDNRTTYMKSEKKSTREKHTEIQNWKLLRSMSSTSQRKIAPLPYGDQNPKNLLSAQEKEKQKHVQIHHNLQEHSRKKEKGWSFSLPERKLWRQTQQNVSKVC